jgi:hypothetical protein
MHLFQVYSTLVPLLTKIGHVDQDCESTFYNNVLMTNSNKSKGD